MADMENIFMRLNEVISQQQELIHSISEKVQQIESIGGGGSGNASIGDYESGVVYKRNTLVVDTETETVYRVIEEYTSDTVKNDCANGKLKLVGFESQVVSIPHNPTQKEIDQLPDDSVVVVYSTADAPYLPDESGY